jgi:dihydrofolate reductase
MRTLIVTEFVTLDGVMESPGGEAGHPHSGWVFDYFGPEQGEYKLAETLAAETLLIGRKTYDGFAAAWPSRDGEFADKMNTMEKVVVSTTLVDPEWKNTRVLSGDVVGGVRELKQGDGGPILVAGSKTLVDTLIENDLVDVLRLMVFPVVVGGGLRLFPDTRQKSAWRVAESVTFPSMVRVDEYHLLPAGG